jgi:hypothetical protein
MAILNTSYISETFFPHGKGNYPPDVPGNGICRPPVASSSTPVLADIAFLFPYLIHLHTIVVVGSAAQGTQTEESDLDFVVITKENCLEDICGAVFENDIEMNFAGTGGTKLEVTVLTEGQAEELFSMASPFAFAIRYGTVLFDDGYLETLLAKPNPRVPIREYYTKSLFENVACQYFSVVKQLERTVRQKGCSADCCAAENSRCSLLPAAMLPILIFRMLYLTLPYRGLMPLSKDDVVVFAEAFYPSEVSNAVKKAAVLSRSKSDVIPFHVYRSLKLASVKLFREILTILDYQQDVRQIVHDAANSVCRNFDEIENSLLKKCFV